jgi:hypothetical protein
MAKRENPYEAAFAAWLRQLAVPFIEINESQRQFLGDKPWLGEQSTGERGTTKNLDFIVTVPRGTTWLVDVKGRHFPGGKQHQYWKNWATRDDLHGLAGWENIFGSGSGALLVFAYQLRGERSPLPLEELFCHQQQWYAFVAIRWFDYASAARPISPKWGTVALPSRRFRELALPARSFFQPESAPRETTALSFTAHAG